MEQDCGKGSNSNFESRETHRVGEKIIESTLLVHPFLAKYLSALLLVSLSAPNEVIRTHKTSTAVPQFLLIGEGFFLAAHGRRMTTAPSLLAEGLQDETQSLTRPLNNSSSVRQSCDITISSRVALHPKSSCSISRQGSAGEASVQRASSPLLYMPML